MIISGAFAAIITVLTLFVKIYTVNGYIHLGDSVIYLAACILPFPYALIAAGLGGALADTLGSFAIYSVPTFIIKVLITLPYTPKSKRILTKRNSLMVIPAGIITVVGYFITGWIFFGWSGAVAGLTGDVIQAAGSAVLFFIIAAALDKIEFKKNFTA